MKAVMFTSGFLLIVLPKPAIAQACVQATQRIQVPEQIHLVQACQSTPEIFPKLSFLLSDHGIDVYRVEWPVKKSAAEERMEAYKKTETPAQRAFDAKVAKEETDMETSAAKLKNVPHPKPKSPEEAKFDAREDQQDYEALHPPPPNVIGVEALFVFQDEAERRLQVNAMIAAGESFNWLRGGFRSDSTLPADWTPASNIKYGLYSFTILNGTDVLLREVDLYAPLACYAYSTACIVGNVPPDFKPSNLRTSEIANYQNISPPPLPHSSLGYRVAMMLMKEKYTTPEK